MDSSSPNSEEDSPSDAQEPGSSRHTTHTGKQDGLGYGLGVAWHHLRPFIPFFLISSLVVALIYLLQRIIYGGPFTDPLFFVKFNERWPKPEPDRPAPTELFSPIPSFTEQDLFDLSTDNGTI